MRKTRLEDTGDGLEWREDGLGTTERPAGPQGRDNGLGRAAVVQKEVEQITRRHRPSIGNKPKRLQQRSQTIQELREVVRERLMNLELICLKMISKA